MLGIIKDQKDDSLSIKSYITNLFQYLKSNIKFFNTILPSPSHSETTIENNNHDKDLFPKQIIYKNDLLSNSTATPCSTDLNKSKISKFENNDGVIHWKFKDDEDYTNSNSITSPFLTSTGSTISTNGEFSPINHFQFNSFHHQINTPSPVTINNTTTVNTTNNNNDNDNENNNENTIKSSSLPSTIQSSDIDSLEDLSIIPDLPNPEFFDLKMNEQMVKLKQIQEVSPPELSPTSSNDEKSHHHDTTSSNDHIKSNKFYTCEYCGSEFKIRGYLTRHIKKHALTKAYECPFFELNSENKCHPNGGFSRRDTYKTHLKSRHFKYPSGTKSSIRFKTPGKCGICNKHFQNNEDWVENHIENGECQGLPTNYQIRNKNSRRKKFQYPMMIDKENDGLIKNNKGILSPTSSLNDSPLFQNPQLNNHNDLIKNGNDNGTTFINDDFDNNDEFSLDVEQSISFRPINGEFIHSY